ncbi:eukaryotic translation initiation factor 3subunit L, partial [Striga asiatica]
MGTTIALETMVEMNGPTVTNGVLAAHYLQSSLKNGGQVIWGKKVESLLSILWSDSLGVYVTRDRKDEGVPNTVIKEISLLKDMKHGNIVRRRRCSRQWLCSWSSTEGRQESSLGFTNVEDNLAICEYVFSSVRKQQLLSGLRTFLKVYLIISIPKLAAYLEVGELKEVRNPSFRTILMTYKHKTHVVDSDGKITFNAYINFYVVASFYLLAQSFHLKLVLRVYLDPCIQKAGRQGFFALEGLHLS